MIDGKRFNFQASGSLWKDALVMQDLETKSLWSQILGECIQGEMEGTKLALFNSAHTTFGKFKTKFPNGKLLKKPEKGDEGSTYRFYFKNRSKFGIFGHHYKIDRIPQKSYVYGLRLACKDIAVTQEYLEKNQKAIIECGDKVVVLNYDAETQLVSAYETIKNVSGSTGNTDAEKTPVPVLTSFWFAWVNFFPDTELVN